MTSTTRTRLLRLLWLAGLVLFVGVWLYPVSSRTTRATGLGLFVVVWLGLIGLCWRRRAVRFPLLGLTLLSAGFLISPARGLPAADALRRDYVSGLGRYDGTPYYWGGESPTGIDCSGLVRRGLVDALFCRGLRTLDPGLVRRALSLWWHDATADELGRQHAGLTVHLLDAPSVNALDPAQVLPGDLAVVGDGAHVMAYLGDHVWIEADPGARRVVRVAAPAAGDPWFRGPATVVRWAVFER